MFWKSGELRVNLDPTILLKGEQWLRLEVGKFKMPFDACIRDHSQTLVRGGLKEEGWMF